MSDAPSTQQLAAGWVNKQGAHLKSKEESTLQAALMAAERIGGATQADIARRYGVSVDLVAKRLEMARKQNLLKGAADQVIETLLPRAQKVYDRVMDTEADSFDPELALKAAKDVMFGTGVLSNANRAQIAPAQTDITAKIETLDDYRKFRESQGKGGVVIEAEVMQVESPDDVDGSLPALLPAGADPSPERVHQEGDGDAPPADPEPGDDPQSAETGAEVAAPPADPGDRTPAGGVFARGVYLR